MPETLTLGRHFFTRGIRRAQGEPPTSGRVFVGHPRPKKGKEVRKGHSDSMRHLPKATLPPRVLPTEVALSFSGLIDSGQPNRRRLAGPTPAPIEPIRGQF